MTDDIIVAGDKEGDYQNSSEYDIRQGIDPTEARSGIDVRYNAEGDVEVTGSLSTTYEMNEDIDRVPSSEEANAALERNKEPTGLDALDKIQ